jgi:hypothetical protein
MTVLADIKQTVTVVDRSSYTEDTYGTRTVTGSVVYTPPAYIVLLTAADEEVKSGTLNTGDARLYMAGAGSVLKPGQLVEYKNKAYEIVGEPLPFDIGGTIVHYEANLKRIHQP